MKKFTIWFKNNKKMKIIAETWKDCGSGFIMFTIGDTEVARVKFDEIRVLKREVIR